MRDDRYRHQADNNDYKSNSDVYNRGHLFPADHAFDNSDKVSTFTLTNVVPQTVSFNGGSWQKMETCVKCVMQKYCINNNRAIQGFVLTGAKPSNNNNKLNKRVNIPTMLWSAFCCYSSRVNKWLASAHWGYNVVEVKSTYLQTKTLKRLKDTLGLEVFPGSQCPQDETVSEFYLEINAENKHCQCPTQVTTTSAAPTTTVFSTTTEPTASALTNTRPQTTTMNTTAKISTGPMTSELKTNTTTADISTTSLLATVKGTDTTKEILTTNSMTTVPETNTTSSLPATSPNTALPDTNTAAEMSSTHVIQIYPTEAQPLTLLEQMSILFQKAQSLWKRFKQLCS
ncbi:uncharacterized protein LOC119027738 [Xyrichtys novacula]|uniref:Uncharacterized protein LOC119027738 n=1 Tax=Xyrichtys novacula TaxID=13765 RepID=A0AAV1HJP1_XYRNO|nr:uncharacterized protein LOC119027738 [Xyrichtys novacula]